MKVKSYTISFQKINEFSSLAKSLPTQLLTKSRYFKNVKDIFWRVTSLEDKYKTLMEKIRDCEIQADELIRIKNFSGIEALNKRLSQGDREFSSISFSSDDTKIYFGPKKIDIALQDFITRFSELLETLKYILADIFNDNLGNKDSFNQFILKKKPKITKFFDFNYLTDFNKYLWNQQKHSFNISTTPFVFEAGELYFPKINSNGRFRKKEIRIFIEESLDEIIKLLLFFNKLN